MHFVVIDRALRTRAKWLNSLYGSSTKTDSLLFLDLSNNSIQHVEGLPSKAKIILSLNHRPLDFARGVLTEAHCLSLQKRRFLINCMFPEDTTFIYSRRSRKYARLFSPCHSRSFFPKVPPQIFALLLFLKIFER